MNASTSRIICVAIAVLAATLGCHKQSQAPEEAFKTASAENQARWQLASQAANTNGYVTAMMTLRKLQVDPALTQDQQAAVTTLMAKVNESLLAAEQAGDAGAKQAMEEIRRRWRFP